MRIFLSIPDIGSYGRPMALAGRSGGESWSWGASRFNTVREHQDLWLLVRVTRTGTRMALNHSLGREEGLNLFTQNGNALGLLDSEIKDRA